MDTSWALHGAVPCRQLRVGGVTLVELCVTVAVLAVLAAGALQFSAAGLGTMRLTNTANGFLAHLAQVRSEAIKRNAPVALCKSQDGELCVVAGGWEQGWIAFHDPNNNALRDPGEPVLLRSQALPAGLRLTGNSTVSAYVSFSGMGSTQATNGAFQAGTLTLCRVSAEATEGRQIVINAAGRPRVRKAMLASCE